MSTLRTRGAPGGAVRDAATPSLASGVHGAKELSATKPGHLQGLIAQLEAEARIKAAKDKGHKPRPSLSGLDATGGTEGPEDASDLGGGLNPNGGMLRIGKSGPGPPPVHVTLRCVRVTRDDAEALAEGLAKCSRADTLIVDRCVFDDDCEATAVASWVGGTL